VSVDLTDEQWAAIEHAFPKGERTRTSPKGGRPWRDPRDVVNGVLWILRTGAPWADSASTISATRDVPPSLPRLVKDGVLVRMLRDLAEDLKVRGKLDLTEAFVDGSHAGAKRGALWLGSLAAAKRPRSWQWQTALVFLSPSGLSVVSAMKRSS
jgi:transposase